MCFPMEDLYEGTISRVTPVVESLLSRRKRRSMGAGTRRHPQIQDSEVAFGDECLAEEAR